MICSRAHGVALILATAALCGCEDATPPVAPASPELDNNESSALASFEFPSGSWSTVGQMPERLWRFDLAAGVVTAEGRSIVYVLGGRYEQSPLDLPAASIFAYDVENDAWTSKTAQYTGAPTNGAGIINGKLYVAGGATFSGLSWTEESSRLFAYDIAADRVIRRADMPRATAEGVTGVIHGKLYVLAGRCGEALCRRFYRYDPATNTWATLPSAPNSHRHGAGVVLGGKFYVAGGGSSPFRAFDVYDPATNAWRAPSLMPPRRQFAVGAPLESKVYVIGISGDERLGSQTADRKAVSYKPSTGVWRNETSFPGPTGEGGQFLLRPGAALRVLLRNQERILTVGSGHLFTDDTVRPAGTIEPTLSYIYTP